MDSASVQSLTPILDGVDRWVEIAQVLPILIILELILSADNAVALASISRKLNNIALQRQALNFGVSISLILRLLLLLGANLIIKYPLFKLVASFYLFVLVFKFYLDKNKSKSIDYSINSNSESSSLLSVITLLAITDLAFSIDSVTTAVAISDQILLVVTGTLVGVVALRFTADLFIRWLELFTNLESAGYIAVALVALKLLLQCLLPNLDLPDYLFFAFIFSLLLWGFSKRSE